MYVLLLKSLRILILSLDIHLTNKICIPLALGHYCKCFLSLTFNESFHFFYMKMFSCNSLPAPCFSSKNSMAFSVLFSEEICLLEIFLTEILHTSFVKDSLQTFIGRHFLFSTLLTKNHHSCFL